MAKELEARLKGVDSLPVLQRLVIEAARAQALEEFLGLLDRMKIEAPAE
mgnify:CR=1 FL=1